MRVRLMNYAGVIVGVGRRGTASRIIDGRKSPVALHEVIYSESNE
jgi:hypothetical protein